MNLSTALLLPFMLSASLVTSANASQSSTAGQAAPATNAEEQTLPEVFVSKEGYNPKLFAIFDSLPGAHSEKGSTTECLQVGKAPKYYQWNYKKNGSQDSRGLHFYIQPESYPHKQTLSQHVEYAKSSKFFPVQAKKEFFQQFEQLSLTAKPQLSIVECAARSEDVSPLSAVLKKADASRGFQPYTDQQGTNWTVITIAKAEAWAVVPTFSPDLTQAMLLFSEEIANRRAAGQSAWKIHKEELRTDNKLESLNWTAEFRYETGRAELLTVRAEKGKVRYFWAVAVNLEERPENEATPATSTPEH